MVFAKENLENKGHWSSFRKQKKKNKCHKRFSNQSWNVEEVDQAFGIDWFEFLPICCSKLWQPKNNKEEEKK